LISSVSEDDDECRRFAFLDLPVGCPLDCLLTSSGRFILFCGVVLVSILYDFGLENSLILLNTIYISKLYLFWELKLTVYQDPYD